MRKCILFIVGIGILAWGMFGFGMRASAARGERHQLMPGIASNSFGVGGTDVPSPSAPLSPSPSRTPHESKMPEPTLTPAPTLQPSATPAPTLTPKPAGDLVAFDVSGSIKNLVRKVTASARGGFNTVFGLGPSSIYQSGLDPQTTKRFYGMAGLLALIGACAIFIGRMRR